MDTLPQEIRESIARALPTGRNRTALASVSRSLRTNIPVNVRNERVTRRRWVSARYTTVRMPRLDIVFFCTRTLQYNPVPSLIPWVEGPVSSANDSERSIIHNANPFSIFSAIALFLGEITEYFTPTGVGRQGRRRIEPSGYNFADILACWDTRPVTREHPRRMRDAETNRRLDLLRGRMNRNKTFRRHVMTLVLPFLRHIVVSMRQHGFVNAQIPTNRQEALTLYNQWVVVGLAQAQIMQQIIITFRNIPMRREITMILVRFIHIEL